MTPMQEQYFAIKKKYPDTILLFRLGDFYEAFNEDATTLSRVLGITLTGRGKDENRTPMAGIPYHALATYMPKMVEAKLKVAIADQMTEPTPGKLVEREITKIITPGTIIDENSLDNSKNNYIASIYLLTDKRYGDVFTFVLCDLTTGELKVLITSNSKVLTNEIGKFKPAEIIVSKFQKDIFSNLPYYLNFVDDLTVNKSQEVLHVQFQVKTLKGFGLDPNLKVENKKHLESNACVVSLAILISYLKDCQKGELKHIKSLKIYSYQDIMQLDSETIRNLELLFSNNNEKNTTLFEVLNKCKTSMGQRKLRNWIITPLTHEKLVSQRLNAVDLFYKDRVLTQSLRDQLSQISDIERIMGRVGLGSANPKDLVALRLSCEVFLDFKIDEFEEIQYILDKIDNSSINELIEFLKESLDDDPSVLLAQGNVIREGYNQKIDELRSLRRDVKQILLDMQKRESVRTGISSLKISYNNVFGYYIEVTKTHIDKVPNDYIRKQTLANGERYITEELKQLETRILSAEEELLKLENELFFDIRNKVATYSESILDLANSIAVLDILSNFGEISRDYRFVKPIISQSYILKITAGRHPVVERLVDNFTANDIELDDEKIISIITGPNMSGKSTFIRQVALICLMAQIGCFVPADSMEFGLLDRIFTRVGASDNLSKGESTFMVEMSETANILNNATSKSLVILDEIGRGTSTYDGVAIAWSVVEYIHSRLKAKTLFATHYHELTDMKNEYKGIVNHNVKVLEEKDEILFTHKIIPGSADKSYGVYVAQIAGVPTEIITRSNEILKKFETQTNATSAKTSKSPNTPKQMHPEQLGLI